MSNDALKADGASSNWSRRHALGIVAFAPLVAQMVGSLFNIWYNLLHIEPLLTQEQHNAFLEMLLPYNLVAYSGAFLTWCWFVFSLYPAYRAALAGGDVKNVKWRWAHRRAINLPGWSAVLSGSAWGLGIPVFLIALSRTTEPVDASVYAHLPISLMIGGVIAVTQGAFAVDMASQRFLLPVLFPQAGAEPTPGAMPLTLRGRGIMYAMAAGVCPIMILLLLILAPGKTGVGFAVTGATVGSAFALSTAWLMGRIITQPILALQRAAKRVANGDLNAHVDLVRADEFGTLISEFNWMVGELREKQHIQETFGHHVGQRAANLVLQRDPNLGGVEQPLTVMFVDIRNFTSRCSACPAQTVVSVLNTFFTEMVEVVEQQCGGMVNKFIGDGFMALFGAEDVTVNHGAMAVDAGRHMLRRMERVNARLQAKGYADLAIGIGIHTGTAVVGSIGSPRRKDFTAIGDTVNVASRVESLTKQLGVCMLITETTRAMLPGNLALRSFPPQNVKGKDDAIQVYGFDTELPSAHDSEEAP